tara:strand:- start:1207 stop:1506 length:300 start_codon:yes stop_codon:yes gene_type:complete
MSLKEAESKYRNTFDIRVHQPDYNQEDLMHEMCMSIYHNHQHQKKVNRDPRNGHRVRAFPLDDRIHEIQSLAHESLSCPRGPYTQKALKILIPSFLQNY